MAKKRLTLPKNIKDLLLSNDMEALKKVYDICEINAYQGYNKEPALSMFNISDEFVQWLVDQGADINQRDVTYHRTPLHLHAMRRSGKLSVFLKNGAAVDAKDTTGNTALHFAAGSSYNVDGIKELLAFGADPLAINNRGITALDYAMAGANNVDIVPLVAIVELLLEAGDEINAAMEEAVIRIGKNFEFHRHNFNPDFLPPTAAALTKLYSLFSVAPVERRILHDGISLIEVQEGNLMEQHLALWKLLVPSSGAAATIQGEVIRVSGKIQDEILRNGGANWDSDFKKMLQNLGAYIRTGIPLNSILLTEIDYLIDVIQKKGDGDQELARICELSVIWVKENQTPIPLGVISYTR